jgi:hypothetical protein
MDYRFADAGHLLAFGNFRKSPWQRAKSQIRITRYDQYGDWLFSTRPIEKDQGGR